MKLDIDEILADMLSAIKGTVAENWKEVQSIANQFLQNKKERLELLAELRINGDLNQEKFESYLEDEKLVLEAELHAIAIISKAIAQKATNAAISVLEKAVKAIISSVV
jgi:thiaminase